MKAVLILSSVMDSKITSRLHRIHERSKRSRFVVAEKQTLLMSYVFH